MVKVIFENKKKEIKVEKASVKEIARLIGISLQNYIPKVNNRIVPDVEVVSNDDVVEFIRVISGG
jgi:sulfur carrier protein ThiS